MIAAPTWWEVPGFSRYEVSPELMVVRCRVQVGRRQKGDLARVYGKSILRGRSPVIRLLSDKGVWSDRSINTLLPQENQAPSKARKLTEAQVLEIRQRYPHEMGKVLAWEFKVSIGTIRRVGQGKLYRETLLATAGEAPGDTEGSGGGKRPAPRLSLPQRPRRSQGETLGIPRVSP